MSTWPDSALEPFLVERTGTGRALSRACCRLPRRLPEGSNAGRAGAMAAEATEDEYQERDEKGLSTARPGAPIRMHRRRRGVAATQQSRRSVDAAASPRPSSRAAASPGPGTRAAAPRSRGGRCDERPYRAGRSGSRAADAATRGRIERDGRDAGDGGQGDRGPGQGVLRQPLRQAHRPPGAHARVDPLLRVAEIRGRRRPGRKPTPSRRVLFGRRVSGRGSEHLVDILATFASAQASTRSSRSRTSSVWAGSTRRGAARPRPYCFVAAAASPRPVSTGF